MCVNKNNKKITLCCNNILAISKQCAAQDYIRIPIKQRFFSKDGSVAERFRVEEGEVCLEGSAQNFDPRSLL